MPLGHRLLETFQDLGEPKHIHHEDYARRNKYQKIAEGVHLLNLSNEQV